MIAPVTARVRVVYLRISPELHAQLTELAERREVSLNRLCETELRATVEEATEDRLEQVVDLLCAGGR